MDGRQGERDETDARLRFCTSCGQPAAPGRFCGRCGASLEVAAAPRVPQQQVPDDRPTVVLPAAADPEALDLAWVEDGEAAAPRRRSRWVLPLVAVVVALLAVGGVLVGRWAGDADVRRALASSTREVNRVVVALTRATDSAAVQAAASGAATAADRVQQAADGLPAGADPEQDAVRAQLQAEHGLLEAVARLERVDDAPLSTWGGAHRDLTEALQAETASRRVLAGLRRDDAAALADTGPVLEAVTAAVGPALVADASAQAQALLERLHDAALTADLREVGDGVAAEQGAVADAAEALPEGDGRTVLAGYAAALTALGELSSIDADHTGGWSGTRADLAQSFGQVATAAGESGGAGVREALERALEVTDGVVARASAAIADWEVKTQAAVEAQKTDTEALASYSAAFRAQAEAYEQLREDLATFTARVEDPAAGVTYDEAYAFLFQAGQERSYVRDVLIGLDVPPGVRDAHDDVVAAVDRAIDAVQAADDGLEQSEDCFYGECPYYRDTPGWQTFQAESDAVGEAYGAARTTWDGDAAAAKASISSRVLPAKPEV